LMLTGSGGSLHAVYPGTFDPITPGPRPDGEADPLLAP
jgi:hypothetical protein